MATIYRAPEDWKPDWTAKDWQAEQAREGAYIERMQDLARANEPGDDLVGEILRFGRGDGYAQYIVWRTKPLQLVWLQVGDAWSIEPALARGLRLADVRAMVEADRRLGALFGKRKRELMRE